MSELNPSSRRWKLPPKPMHEERLSLYGDISYFLFLIPLALTLWLLRRADPLLSDLTSSYGSWLAWIIEVVFQHLPLPTAIAFKLSLLELFAVFYILLMIRPQSRRKMGEFIAGTGSWLLHRLIEFSEWCLGNRWGALALLVLLCCTLTLNISTYTTEVSRRTKIEAAFADWLDSTELLLDTTKLDGTEASRFSDAGNRWKTNFDLVLDPRDRSLAQLLYHAMVALHKDYNGSTTSWLDHLQGIEPDIHQISEQAVKVGGKSVLAKRLISAIQLLHGMVHVRLAGDNCHQTQDILEANQLILPGPGRCCSQGANNWRGNIYNCAHQYFLDHLGDHRTSSHAQLRDIIKICASQPECLQKALDSYTAAAVKTPECSFPFRRRLNNSLDLNLKIATHYDLIARNGNPSWLRSRDDLASDIEATAKDLMRCNKIGQVEPLTLVTTAQAFAAAAALHAPDSNERKLDLRNAGAFLRLGYSFRLQDLDNWDLACFCPAIEATGLNADFRQGMDLMSGLPRIDDQVLRRSISLQCQPGT